MLGSQRSTSPIENVKRFNVNLRAAVSGELLFSTFPRSCRPPNTARGLTFDFLILDSRSNLYDGFRDLVIPNVKPVSRSARRPFQIAEAGKRGRSRAVELLHLCPIGSCGGPRGPQRKMVFWRFCKRYVIVVQCKSSTFQGFLVVM
jgi:hypothetical protein